MEFFKEIEYFDGYKISSEGYIITKYGNKLIGIITNGRKIVTLHKRNTWKDFELDRLILDTFKPIENSIMYKINHIDGDKLNNKLDNLEWIICEIQPKRVD